MLVTSIPGVSCPTTNACTVLSGTTADLVGAPVAWALTNGDGTKVDGHNVTIAVIDSGVHKTHNAFLDQSGQTRVIFEGCFGTDNNPVSPNEYSRCPQKIGTSGDSPFGFSGSGLPEYAAYIRGANVFDHGTKVAGIAAGVAPKASLASINTTSNISVIGGVGLKYEEADILAALQAIDANKTSYGGNVVVNLSLNFIEDCSDPTNAMYMSTQMVIDSLVNGGNIPVIVGAGNTGGSVVTLPGCLSNRLTWRLGSSSERPIKVPHRAPMILEVGPKCSQRQRLLTPAPIHLRDFEEHRELCEQIPPSPANRHMPIPYMIHSGASAVESQNAEIFATLRTLQALEAHRNASN